MTIARIFVLQLVIAWVTRIMKKTSVQFARILITPTIIPFYEWKRIKKLWFQNEDSIQSWKYIRHCFSKHDPKTDKYHILARPTRIMKKTALCNAAVYLLLNWKESRNYGFKMKTPFNLGNTYIQQCLCFQNMYDPKTDINQLFNCPKPKWTYYAKVHSLPWYFLNLWTCHSQ